MLWKLASIFIEIHKPLRNLFLRDTLQKGGKPEPKKKTLYE